MKTLRLLIILIFSAIFFAIGLAIPRSSNIFHIAFIIAGVVLGFLFYLLSLLHAIKTPALSGGKRIFWIVAIVCVPMIGNVIYILLQDTFNRKQIPKPDKF